MRERDLHVLDGYPLLPRLLHGVERPDSRVELLGRLLPLPLVPEHAPWRSVAPDAPLVRVDAASWRERRDAIPAERCLVRLEPGRMGELVPLVRQLGELEPAGLLLDLTPLADGAPFGTVPWRPRQREELAELCAAAGRPLWLDGVASAGDAEVAAEAGVDAVVVRSGVGRHLGGAAAAELLPELLDAVAGMVGVHVGGTLRDGVDLFRYLALGADAVLVDGSPDTARLEAELHYAMRLTGCATLADVGYECLFAPLYEEGP